MRSCYSQTRQEIQRGREGHTMLQTHAFPLRFLFFFFTQETEIVKEKAYIQFPVLRMGFHIFDTSKNELPRKRGTSFN